MTVLHLIPPLVVGTVAALVGAVVAVVAGLNAYLSVLVAVLVGELGLTLVFARFAPPRATLREALFVAGFCLALGAVPCVFVSSFFLSADLAKIQRQREK